jgi:hypothetical protein
MARTGRSLSRQSMSQSRMETGNAKHAIHLIDLTADHYFGERQLFSLALVCAGVLAAQGLSPPTALALPRPTTDLADVKGLNCGNFNRCRDGVIGVAGIESQPAEFLFDLKHLKWASSFLFSGGDNRLEALTQPPE